MDFVEWVLEEMTLRGWGNNEFARQAKMPASSASDMLNRQRSPNYRFCSGVSRAFHIPLETVLRRAGLLPNSDTPPSIHELAWLFEQLNDNDQEEMLRLVKAMIREKLTRYELNKNPSET